ncbi:(2Fe-2S)-binding protein [Bradyrhizobium sp. BR13661]|uniref:(2Fe-2S)-binding protein n=1 Tax=Bradyrhizobium sp. BR13661 TaxID=2940622 RepID=UPI00247636C7|nr:(2Fe-2S)-binding protein [Bradyrhizobium sp. BR13661]
MIVCSCNIISDHDIRGAVVATDDELLSAAQVYDCLGCTVRCGRCSQSVRRILDERSSRCAQYRERLHLQRQAYPE